MGHHRGRRREGRRSRSTTGQCLGAVVEVVEPEAGAVVLVVLEVAPGAAVVELEPGAAVVGATELGVAVVGGTVVAGGLLDDERSWITNTSGSLAPMLPWPVVP